MPVQLTQREREIFTAAREFALAHFAPHAAEWEEGRALPATGVEAARRQGFFGVSCPKEVGGKGYDFLETALTYEGLAHGDGGFAFFVQLHNNITFEIATYYDTSDEVKALVPDMVSGKSLTAFALTEKDAGCDPAMSTAYAEEREDGYHIFGEKTWTSDSIDARHFNVIVKDSTPKGMLMLLVDRGTKGFEILEDRRRIGGNAMTCGTLRFSDCVVPKSRLLSADGFREALRAIDVARIFVPAIAVGVAQRAIDITPDYLAKRVTFGTPILRNQAIQWELAEMTAEVEAARWLVYHAASKMDAGEPIAETAAMAKLIAPNTCMKVTTECAQLFGALGCEWNSEISRAMNMAKVMKVVDGSTEIQKIVLGRAIERRAFPRPARPGK